jgi:hypothetical protein
MRRRMKSRRLSASNKFDPPRSNKLKYNKSIRIHAKSTYLNIEYSSYSSPRKESLSDFFDRPHPSSLLPEVTFQNFCFKSGNLFVPYYLPPSLLQNFFFSFPHISLKPFFHKFLKGKLNQSALRRIFNQQ